MGNRNAWMDDGCSLLYWGQGKEAGAAAKSVPDSVCNRELCEPFLPPVSTFQAAPFPHFLDQWEETRFWEECNISDLPGPPFCFPQKLQQEALDKWPPTQGLLLCWPSILLGDWLKLLSLV